MKLKKNDLSRCSYVLGILFAIFLISKNVIAVADQTAPASKSESKSALKSASMSASPKSSSALDPLYNETRRAVDNYIELDQTAQYEKYYLKLPSMLASAIARKPKDVSVVHDYRWMLMRDARKVPKSPSFNKEKTEMLIEAPQLRVFSSEPDIRIRKYIDFEASNHAAAGLAFLKTPRNLFEVKPSQVKASIDPNPTSQSGQIGCTRNKKTGEVDLKNFSTILRFSSQTLRYYRIKNLRLCGEIDLKGVQDLRTESLTLENANLKIVSEVGDADEYSLSTDTLKLVGRNTLIVTSPLSTTGQSYPKFINLDFKKIIATENYLKKAAESASEAASDSAADTATGAASGAASGKIIERPSATLMVRTSFEKDPEFDNADGSDKGD